MGRRIAGTESLSAWFSRFGRELPWRDATDPYAILVSEEMLPQTARGEVGDATGAPGCGETA